MNKLLRRTISAIFFLSAIVGFAFFYTSVSNISQYTITMWSLFITCVSVTIVLVLNH